MTNEEAKKIIFGQWQAFLEDNIDYAGISEAYMMAMKALETTCIEDYPTCTECEHYDSEKHYCPRFCQVIKDTLAEAQPCEDCISREAVTDTTICEGISCNECSFNTCEDGQRGCLLKERVDKLPSVTPQRPKGKWISHREHCENLGVMPSGLGAYEWCSNCDCGIDVIEWHRNPYNYCPNCGAEMSGGEEDEG